AEAWLPGQAVGAALADVLLGHAEPGGRLPVTLPAAEADCPVLHALPRDSRLDYAEGLLIGYRGYDAAGITPMFPFGHGLGYTSWDYESLNGPAAVPDPRARAGGPVRGANTRGAPGRGGGPAKRGRAGGGAGPVRRQARRAGRGGRGHPAGARRGVRRVRRGSRAVVLAPGRVHGAGRAVLAGPAAIAHRPVRVRPRRSRRRDELHLVAVPVLEVGRVVIEATGVRGAGAAPQPPPLLRGLVRWPVHPLPARRVGGRG